MNKTEIFIDAEYLLQSIRRLKNKPQNQKISKNNFNWKAFIDFISKDFDVCSIYYYTARLDENENPKTFNDQKEFLQNVEDNLNSYNFKLRMGKMIKVRLKNQSTWNQNNHKYKEGNLTWVQKGIDTKIVLDLCTLINRSPEISSTILITGDSDFCEVLEYLKSKNVDVTLITFERYDSHTPNDLVAKAANHIKIDYEILSEFKILN